MKHVAPALFGIVLIVVGLNIVVYGEAYYSGIGLSAVGLGALILIGVGVTQGTVRGLRTTLIPSFYAYGGLTFQRQHMFGMLLVIATIVVSIYVIYLSRRLNTRKARSRDRDE